MTRYTVFSNTTDPIRDLTITEAAHEILTDDGAEYELRLDNGIGIWELYCRRRRIHGFRVTYNYGDLVCSIKTRLSDAWEDIAGQVVFNDWGGLDCMADDDYAAMERDLAADE